MRTYRHPDIASAETWLQAHRIKLTDRIGGRRICEASAPVGLRVLATIDYIKGMLVYTGKIDRARDWQNPPRLAFIRRAA